MQCVKDTLDSVHSNIDYPTVKNTLYENQKLLHLLNMTAGDELYLGERLVIGIVEL